MPPLNAMEIRYDAHRIPWHLTVLAPTNARLKPSSTVELVDHDDKKVDLDEPAEDESPSGPFILTPKVLLSIALGQACHYPQPMVTSAMASLSHLPRPVVHTSPFVICARAHFFIFLSSLRGLEGYASRLLAWGLLYSNEARTAG